MSPHSVLRRVNLPLDFLTSTGIEVRGQQFLNLLKFVKEETGDEFFCLTPRACKSGTFGMMAETGLHCETLKAFIENCCRFYYFVTDDLVINWRVEGETVTVSVRQNELSSDPDQFLSEFWLLHLHRMLSWVTGVMLPLQAVTFSCGEYSGSERLLYYVRSDWQAGDSENSFQFHCKYLSLPIVRTLPELHQHLGSAEGQNPIWPDDLYTWSAKVKVRLKSSFETRYLAEDIDRVAEGLCTTSRSLRRHLQDEGTTYQKILDELRLNMAVEKLYMQHLSVADVAEQLGFSESRSFSRAFKQWTGTTPGRYQETD